MSRIDHLSLSERQVLLDWWQGNIKIKPSCEATVFHAGGLLALIKIDHKLGLHELARLALTTRVIRLRELIAVLTES